MRSKRQSHTLFSGISELSERVSHAISASALGKLFSSADETDAMLKSGAIASFAEKTNFYDGILRKTRRTVTRSIENSTILNGIRNAVGFILNKPLRTYGLLLTFTAMMGADVFALGFFDLLPIGYSVDNLIMYALMFCFGIPLLLSGRSTVETVGSSFFIGRFLKGGIAVDAQKLRKGRVTSTAGFTCLLVAAMITVISIFLPIRMMLKILFITALYLFLLYNPESGLMICLMLMLLIPQKVIYDLLTFVSVSYVIKLIRAKRSFSLKTADVFVLILFLYRASLTLLAGGKSIEFKYILFMAVFFVAENLVLTKKQFSTSFACITFGVVTGSLLRVAGYALDYFEIFPEIKALLSWDAIWAGDMFCDICVIALPLCLAWVLNRYSRAHFLGYILVSAPVIACVVFTGNGNQWIALAASLLIYFLLAYRTRLIFFILGLITLPAVCFAAIRFESLTPITENIYSGIIYRYGIVGIMALALVFFLLMRLFFSAKTLSRGYELYDQSIHTGKYHGLVAAAGALMLTVLIYGFFSGAGGDAGMMLFWTCAGLSGAAANMFVGRGA